MEVAKKASRTPEEFGKGSLEGVAAAEHLDTGGLHDTCVVAVAIENTVADPPPRFAGLYVQAVAAVVLEVAVTRAQAGGPPDVHSVGGRLAHPAVVELQGCRVREDTIITGAYGAVLEAAAGGLQEVESLPGADRIHVRGAENRARAPIGLDRQRAGDGEAPVPLADDGDAGFDRHLHSRLERALGQLAQVCPHARRALLQRLCDGLIRRAAVARQVFQERCLSPR